MSLQAAAQATRPPGTATVDPTSAWQVECTQPANRQSGQRLLEVEKQQIAAAGGWDSTCIVWLIDGKGCFHHAHWPRIYS